jgi:hypothetical protein
MNLLLSALVLAWGFVPPGFEHAHAGGGDSDHQHDKCREVSHHGSHHHDTDDGHHEHATETDVTLLVDQVLHLHWRLLGVKLSVPVPVAPADGDDEDTVPPPVVRAMNEIVPATQAGPSLGRAFLAGICAPSADVVRDLEPIPRPPNLVTSIPLCDSARLERSGVLLV